MELRASEPARRDAPRSAAREPGPRHTSHHAAFFSGRHNYVEGTKMLAAYLYEVSRLKN